MRTRIFAFLSAMILLAPACSKTVTEPSAPSDKAETDIAPAKATPGLIRVKLTREMTESEISTAFAQQLGNYSATRTFPYAGRFEKRHREAGLHLWYDVHFDKNIPLTRAAGGLDTMEGVSIVEYDIPIKVASAFPFNDPDFYKQWHYYNEGNIALGRVAGCDINLLPAWDVSVGRPDVIVAVDDSGVDYEHEDLAANMWINAAEFYGAPGVDDDGNGYVDDIYGYNFTTSDMKNMNGTITPGNHGTHVAGTIAAVNNNGIGLCGIAGGNGNPSSGVRLMSAQTINDNDDPAFSAASFIYAADMGAVLMNCSWSFDGAESTSSYMMEAIDYFNEYAGCDPDTGKQIGPMKGGLIIFAAGNEDTDTCYPSMEENVFAVAALAGDYVKAYYSNYGSWVDIAAPGGDSKKSHLIRSTLPGNKYQGYQGTSMATPHVTGVAALAVSALGGDGFTRSDLIAALTCTANDIIYSKNPGYEGQLGAGLIDAYKVVTFNGVELPYPVTDLTVSPSNTSANLEWTVPGKGSNIPKSYNIYVSKNSLASMDPSALASSVKKYIYTPGPSNLGDKLKYTVTGIDPDTEYHFRISSQNIQGGASDLSEDVAVKTLNNTPPIVNALDGTSLSLASHATGSLRFSISDADNDELTYTLSGGLDGLSSSVKSGVVVLSINALKAEQGKTYNGTLTVSDGLDDASIEFSYSIKLNNAPKAVNRFSDQVIGSRTGNVSVSITDNFSDVDGEILALSAVASPSNIVNLSVSGGKISITARAFGQTTVTVTAKDARGASATQTFRVLVRDSTEPFDLYPNPVKDKLHVRPGSDGRVSMTITNKAGAVVREVNDAEANPFAPYVVDMNDLPGGIYYVKLSGGETEATSYSIVKQ